MKCWSFMMGEILFENKPFNNQNQTLLYYLTIPYLRMRNIMEFILTHHLGHLFPSTVFAIFTLTFKVKVSSKSIIRNMC